MSAFMVDDGVFAQVARFLKEDRPDILSMKHADLELDPVTFVECLRVLNRESIHVRYPDTNGGGMLDPLPLPPIDPLSVPPCSAEQAARHLDCIDYQACETPRWGKSGMQDLVRSIALEIDGTKGKRRDLDLEWGSVAKPKPLPFKLPDGWRDGERNAKVMRSDTLRKLAESGRLELVDSYHFDDMMGSSRHGGAPVPVVFDASENPSYKTGTYTMRPHDVEPCRQWTNAHGTFIYVRHHSNSNVTFRVVDAVKGAA